MKFYDISKDLLNLTTRYESGSITCYEYSKYA